MSRGTVYAGAAIGGAYIGHAIGKKLGGKLGYKIRDFRLFPKLVKNYGYFKAVRIFERVTGFGESVDLAIARTEQQDFYKRAYEIGGESFADYMEFKVNKYYERGLDIDLDKIVEEYSIQNDGNLNELLEALVPADGGPKVFISSPLYKRFIAFLVDILIISLLSVILMRFIGVLGINPYGDRSVILGLGSYPINLVVGIGYSMLCFHFMKSTVGQKIIKIHYVKDGTIEYPDKKQVVYLGVYYSLIMVAWPLLFIYLPISAISAERRTGIDRMIKVHLVDNKSFDLCMAELRSLEYIRNQGKADDH